MLYGSVVDLSVGIYLNKKTGDYTKKGESIAVVHANEKQKGEAALAAIQKAFCIGTEKIQPNDMIQQTIDSASVMNNANSFYI